MNYIYYIFRICTTRAWFKVLLVICKVVKQKWNTETPMQTKSKTNTEHTYGKTIKFLQVFGHPLTSMAILTHLLQDKEKSQLPAKTGVLRARQQLPQLTFYTMMDLFSLLWSRCITLCIQNSHTIP